MIVTRARGRWEVVDVARFLRLFPMGASVVHPLVGMALTVWPRRIGVVTAVTVAGVSFHVFSFVLNDIRDLPIDASDPRRQTSPLVRGMVSTSAAAWLTAAACLLGVALIAIVGGLESVISYLIAILALGIYDLFGKRMPIPGLADVIQGLGWGSLLMAGAYVAGAPSLVAWVAAAHVVVLITLVNGFHGSLRDLANDRAHGARTLPTLLGATTDQLGMPVITNAIRVTVAVLLAVLTGVLGVAVALVISAEGSVVLVVAAVLTHVCSLGLAWLAFGALTEPPRMMRFGMWQLLSAHAALVLLAAALLPGWGQVVLLLTFAAPPAIYAALARIAEKAGT